MSDLKRRAQEYALLALAYRDYKERCDGFEDCQPYFVPEKQYGHHLIPQVELEAEAWNELREELMCDAEVKCIYQDQLYERSFMWYGTRFKNLASKDRLNAEREKERSYEEKWEAARENIDL